MVLRPRRLRARLLPQARQHNRDQIDTDGGRGDAWNQSWTQLQVIYDRRVAGH